jgi:hypothetical protein
MSEDLRSDNGPELIAFCIQDWLKAQAIKTLYIKPGSPWENGHCLFWTELDGVKHACSAPRVGARIHYDFSIIRVFPL